MNAKRKRPVSAVFLLLLTLFTVNEVAAHGERAQQAGIRMRTIHFFDIEIYPRTLKVNEEMTVKGKFIPSENWPDHLASTEGTAFLNIGVPGPKFIRLSSSVNGQPMIRSTSFQEGELYEFEMTLKARNEGEYHVHPVISVQDAGPIIGPGYWVTVETGTAPFENHITTLFGEELDLETHGLSNTIFWSSLWFVIGFAWFGYWLFRSKLPIIMPRYKLIADAKDADDIITRQDQIAGGVCLALCLSIIGFGYLWAEDKYPVTTPLQTGKVKTPLIEWDKHAVAAELVKAEYRIPGRSFKVEVNVTNTLETPVRLAEFTAGGIRFGNPNVRELKPQDRHDLVAEAGLIVVNEQIEPGETKSVVFEANDALWEIQRLTSLIYDPDSRFGGMIQFEARNGQRYPVEIGGAMLPLFN
ncbi:MAG: methane monooxygenase/ammonia monooxygenase subunit B [Pseudomonadales bacterium]|nr:methane monooxygenase/ammonia monooxygenase subunit B [Pseudomonadales bacterium]